MAKPARESLCMVCSRGRATKRRSIALDTAAARLLALQPNHPPRARRDFVELPICRLNDVDGQMSRSAQRRAVAGVAAHGVGKPFAENTARRRDARTADFSRQVDRSASTFWPTRVGNRSQLVRTM